MELVVVAKLLQRTASPIMEFNSAHYTSRREGVKILLSFVWK